MTAKKMSFEEAVSKLENIVTTLENGDLPLEESIKSFEEAVGLVKLCEEKLDGAKQKVKLLVKSTDGIVTDVPFDCDTDET